MSDFDSAWQKWEWAGIHAAAYEADVLAVTTSRAAPPFVRCRTEYAAKRHAFAVIIDDMSPVPASLALRLGDIAHNYRSSLDHLAWALVAAGARTGTLSERQQRDVSFPIVETRADFNSRVARCLPGVGRRDLATVRQYQAFQRGKTLARLHALTILARVNNDDKHRQVQAIPVSPTRGGHKITAVHDCEVTRPPKRRVATPLVVGAELWLIGVRRTGPAPRLSVEVAFDTQPTWCDHRHRLARPDKGNDSWALA